MAAKMKKKAKKSAKKTARRAVETDAVADKVTSLGHDARTAAERRLTLDWALALPWANADVARIERIDTETWHGWEMTPL